MRVQKKITVHTITVVDDCSFLSKPHTVRIREWDDGSGAVEARTVEEGKEIWLEASTLRTKVHRYQKMLERIRFVRTQYNVHGLR